MESPSETVLVCNDLIFTSKVTSTAKTLGTPVRVAASATAAASSVSETTRTVIVDLHDPPASPEDLATLRAAAPQATLVAYGSHVDTARLQAAADAGCDLVLARSQFVERLSQILGG